MDLDYYKEQLEAKEDMLFRTTAFLGDIQKKLEIKNEELNEKQRDILSSFDFAKIIQTSVQPDVNILKVFFKDAHYKVLQQIAIGGDTIFIKNTSSGVFFGLLDATGHGIPAAMLSISGSLILNDVSTSMEIDSPQVLLDLLNYRLYNTFNRNKQSVAHFEGALFYYSFKSNKITYCSANGKALFVTKNGLVTPLSRSKTSIGQNQNIHLCNFELKYEKHGKLVLFSDGLVDQFGGKEDKKYMIRQLRELLQQNHHKTTDALAETILQAHINWKGTNNQTDDLSYVIIEF